MAQGNFSEMYRSVQDLKNYIQANFPFKTTIFVGYVDPTDGDGVQANPNTMYAQLNGQAELVKIWIKTGHENTSWSGLGGILDAPFDGKIKGRLNGEWVEIVSDSGIKTITAGSSNVHITDIDGENIIISVDDTGGGGGEVNPPRPIDLTPSFENADFIFNGNLQDYQDYTGSQYDYLLATENGLRRLKHTFQGTDQNFVAINKQGFQPMVVYGKQQSTFRIRIPELNFTFTDYTPDPDDTMPIFTTLISDENYDKYVEFTLYVTVDASRYYFYFYHSYEGSYSSKFYNVPASRNIELEIVNDNNNWQTDFYINGQAVRTDDDNDNLVIPNSFDEDILLTISAKAFDDASFVYGNDDYGVIANPNNANEFFSVEVVSNVNNAQYKIPQAVGIQFEQAIEPDLPNDTLSGDIFYVTHTGTFNYIEYKNPDSNNYTGFVVIDPATRKVIPFSGSGSGSESGGNTSLQPNQLYVYDSLPSDAKAGYMYEIYGEGVRDNQRWVNGDVALVNNNLTLENLTSKNSVQGNGFNGVLRIMPNTWYPGYTNSFPYAELAGDCYFAQNDGEVYGNIIKRFDGWFWNGSQWQSLQQENSGSPTPSLSGLIWGGVYETFISSPQNNTLYRFTRDVEATGSQSGIPTFSGSTSALKKVFYTGAIYLYTDASGWQLFSVDYDSNIYKDYPSADGMYAEKLSEGVYYLGSLSHSTFGLGVGGNETVVEMKIVSKSTQHSIGFQLLENNNYPIYNFGSAGSYSQGEHTVYINFADNTIRLSSSGGVNQLLETFSSLSVGDLLYVTFNMSAKILNFVRITNSGAIETKTVYLSAYSDFSESKMLNGYRVVMGYTSYTSSYLQQIALVNFAFKSQKYVNKYSPFGTALKRVSKAANDTAIRVTKDNLPILNITSFIRETNSSEVSTMLISREDGTFSDLPLLSGITIPANPVDDTYLTTQLSFNSTFSLLPSTEIWVNGYLTTDKHIEMGWTLPNLDSNPKDCYAELYFQRDGNAFFFATSSTKSGGITTHSFSLGNGYYYTFTGQTSFYVKIFFLPNYVAAGNTTVEFYADDVLITTQTVYTQSIFSALISITGMNLTSPKTVYFKDSTSYSDKIYNGFNKYKPNELFSLVIDNDTETFGGNNIIRLLNPIKVSGRWLAPNEPLLVRGKNFTPLGLERTEKNNTYAPLSYVTAGNTLFVTMDMVNAFSEINVASYNTIVLASSTINAALYANNGRASINLKLSSGNNYKPITIKEVNVNNTILSTTIYVYGKTEVKIEKTDANAPSRVYVLNPLVTEDIVIFSPNETVAHDPANPIRYTGRLPLTARRLVAARACSPRSMTGSISIRITFYLNDVEVGSYQSFSVASYSTYQTLGTSFTFDKYVVSTVSSNTAGGKGLTISLDFE